MLMNKMGPVKSAGRVLQLFEVFAEAGRHLSLAELSRLMAIPRSSCLALIRTLSSRGYLYPLGENAYYPTRLLYHTAEAIALHDTPIQVVLPAMTALRDQTQETVILAKLHHDRVIYLLVVESQQIIRYSARPGHFKPLHGTASGKVLLAAMGEEERRTLFKRYPLTPITSRTLTSVPLLEKDLRAGLSRGWQYAEGENVPDVIAIGAPIYLNGEVFAGVVTGPNQRMKPKVKEHVRVLLDACRRLNARSPKAPVTQKGRRTDIP